MIPVLTHAALKILFSHQNGAILAQFFQSFFLVMFAFCPFSSLNAFSFLIYAR
ncbi:hypothetical protein NAL19_1144 [Pectobacterium sp. F1-1]|nr:hypothetical protein NAL19_1144 [Pectobacterium sp. F1-1]